MNEFSFLLLPGEKKKKKGKIAGDDVSCGLLGGITVSLSFDSWKAGALGDVFLG